MERHLEDVDRHIREMMGGHLKPGRDSLGVGAPQQGQRLGRELVAREQVSLDPWLDPEVPGPGPVFQDADGWGQIDSVSAWESSLTIFNSMEAVPHALRENWAEVVKTRCFQGYSTNTFLIN